MDQTADKETQPAEKTGETVKSSLLKRFSETVGCAVEIMCYKLLFFASYGAFGCLNTFIPLYFKQLGLSAAQTGILVGIRPLCQAIGAPVLGIIADKYKRRRAILFLGACAWLIKNMLILTVEPKSRHCVPAAPNMSNLVKRESSMSAPGDTASNGALQYADRTNPKEKYFIRVDSGELYDVFIVLVVLTLVGELLGSALHPLLDGCTVEYLGDARNSYGRVRFWGSIGMALATFLVGAVINKVTSYYCGGIRKNYAIAFYFFAAFMVISMGGLFFLKIVYREVASAQISRVVNLFNSRLKISFWIATISFAISDGFQMDFNSWFLDDLKATSLIIGMASGLHFLFSAVSYFVANSILETIGYSTTVASGLVLYAALFVCFSFTESPWVGLVFYVAIGGVFSVFWSACVAYVGSISYPVGLGVAGQGELQNKRATERKPNQIFHFRDQSGQSRWGIRQSHHEICFLFPAHGGL